MALYLDTDNFDSI